MLHNTHVVRPTSSMGIVLCNVSELSVSHF